MPARKWSFRWALSSSRCLGEPAAVPVAPGFVDRLRNAIGRARGRVHAPGQISWRGRRRSKSDRPARSSVARTSTAGLAGESQRIFGPIMHVLLLSRARLAGIELAEGHQHFLGSRVGLAAAHQDCPRGRRFFGRLIEAQSAFVLDRICRLPASEAGSRNAAVTSMVTGWRLKSGWQCCQGTHLHYAGSP